MINFFNKKSVGVDISDHTIEAIELNKLEVSSLSRVRLAKGIIEMGRIKNKPALVKALKFVFSGARPKPISSSKIIFGLPESQTFVYVFSLRPHNKKQRDNLVLKEVLSNIPLNREQLVFSYKIIHEGRERIDVLVVAVEKDIILEWQEVFKEVGVDALFDVESLAIFRGLFVFPQKEPVCVVDIGALSTNILIFNKDGLKYSHSINIAGNSFTKEIADNLKINFDEAEKQKREFGLSDENSKIFLILAKKVGLIGEEVKTSVSFYERKMNEKVKRIVLVGGSARLRGMVDYFKTNLGIDVFVGNLVLANKTFPLEYLEAAGSALREQSKKWKADPVLQIKEEKLIKKKNEEDGSIKKIKNDPERELIEKIKKDSKLKLLIWIIILGVALILLTYWFKIK